MVTQQPADVIVGRQRHLLWYLIEEALTSTHLTLYSLWLSQFRLIPKLWQLPQFKLTLYSSLSWDSGSSCPLTAITMRLFIASLLIASCICVALATYCGRPPSVRNGRHSGGSWSSFRLGYVIRYSCNYGYKLRGSTTTTCLFSRTRSYYWSNEAPTCFRTFP